MHRRNIIIGLLGVSSAGIAASLFAHPASVVVQTIVVGQHPARIAVDTRTSRTFVLDDGPLTRNGGGGIIEGNIHILDTRTGAVLRTVPAGTAPNALAVDEQTGRVFVLNSYMHNGGQGTVTVLDARSGQIVRTTQVGDLPMDLALDADAGRLFVLNVANGVHLLHTRYALVSVLDAANGRRIAGFNPAPGDGQEAGASDLAIDPRRHRLVLPVSGPQNRVSIEAFDTRTDALVWRLPVGTNAGADAVCATATGRAFVFLDKRVLVLDTVTGHTIRTIPHPIYGSPRADERTARIFMVAQDWSATLNASNWGRTERGYLSILDARTGAVLHSMPIEWPDGAVVDERTGRLLVSHAGKKLSDGEFAGSGRLDVHDGTTGRLLQTIPLGIGPADIAVDGRNGHLFVVNQGGQVPARDPWGWLPGWIRRRLPFLPAPPGPTRNEPSSVSLIDLGS